VGDVRYVASEWYFGYVDGSHQIKLVPRQTVQTGDPAETYLTQTLQSTDTVLHVDDTTGFLLNQELRVVSPDWQSTFESTINAVDASTITVDDTPGEQFPVRSFVYNLSNPECTAVGLGIYSNGVPSIYDFDPSDPSYGSLFLLTEKYLGLDSPPQPWVWEKTSPWCWPVSNPDWPWTLTSYLDLTRPGLLNHLALTTAVNADIIAANGGAGTPSNYWLKKFKLQEFAAGPREYLRYNYDVEIRGAITENFHPGPAVVREWQEKWAYPDGADWNSIRYIYDETLLAARTQPLTELDGVRRYATTASRHSNTIKVPLLPASPDLLYYGEAP